MMARGEEETSRKMALLEGDRRAYQESAQAAAKTNSQKINDIRKENKALVARLRALKDPVTSGPIGGPKAVQLLDLKVSEQIKKHNALRHQAATKIKRLEELDKKQQHLQMSDGSAKGAGAESQNLRELENRLDKALIKAQEAQFVGKTYKQIITKLQQDRLSFDGRINALEKTVTARKSDNVRLEAMLSDAITARDTARTELAQVEAETQSARHSREQEKRTLQSLAEERRRHHEAMEKRLRLASVGESKEDFGQPLPQDQTLRLAAYERIMQKLKDAAGVADPDEVMARFSGQGQTAQHLAQLLQQNTETHARLKEEFDAASAQLDKAQYNAGASGPARQQVTQSQERLQQVTSRLVSARAEAEGAHKLLAVVRAGVDNLCDRLQRDAKQSSEPRPAGVPDRLQFVATLLRELVQSLGERQDELSAMHDADLGEIVDLPEHNVRVRMPVARKEEDGDDEDSGDETVSREAMKKQAASLVEAKTAKPKKKKRTG